jgi:hypothetical protein
VTQLEFPAAPPLSPLAARILEWARGREPVRFWELQEAFPDENASDLDAAARESKSLRWHDAHGMKPGYYVSGMGVEGVE